MFLIVIEPPCASQVSSERKMPIVPSVTMNGSILPSVVVRPLNRPQSAPTASDSAIAATISSVVFSISPEFRNRIVRPETKAAIAPTERSSPPPVMTSVCPTAIVAMNVLRARTLVRLSKLRKRGLASAPSTQISASARNGATALTLTRRRDAATGASCTACVMPALPSPFAIDARRQHDDRVLGHRLARHFADDPAVPHDDDAVTDPDQLGHLRRDDDHRAALRRERGDEPVDLLLGADVDAARRLVDDDDARIELHHFGEQEFLLVAARHLAGEQALVADADVEALDRLVERLGFLCAVDQRPALEPVERGERQVGRDGLLEQQAFALAVLGQIDDAGAHAGARVGPLLRRSVETDLACALAKAEQRLEQFGPPRADQAGKAEDLARPHAEARRPRRSPDAEMRRLRKRVRLSARRDAADRGQEDRARPSGAPCRPARARSPAGSPPACRRAAPSRRRRRL